MKVLMIAAALLLTSLSFADPYIGITSTAIDTDITDHTGINLSFGVQANDYVGFEGRVLVASSEESYDGVKIELTSMYGAYMTGTLPLTDSLNAYVIAGRTNAEVKGSYGGYSATADSTFTSTGFGFKYSVSEALIVTSEWMDHDGADALSIGFQFDL